MNAAATTTTTTNNNDDNNNNTSNSNMKPSNHPTRLEPPQNRHVALGDAGCHCHEFLALLVRGVGCCGTEVRAPRLRHLERAAVEEIPAKEMTTTTI